MIRSSPKAKVRGSNPLGRASSSMIPKSTPAGVTHGWQPVFGQDHAQNEESTTETEGAVPHAVSHSVSGNGASEAFRKPPIR